MVAEEKIEEREMKIWAKGGKNEWFWRKRGANIKVANVAKSIERVERRVLQARRWRSVWGRGDKER